MDVSAPAGRMNGPFHHLFVVKGLLWIGWCPLTLVRVVLFIQSADSMLIYSKITLIDTSRSNVSPAIWAPLNTDNFPHEIKYHSSHVWRSSLMKVIILDLGVLTDTREGGIWAPDTSHKG